MRPSRPALDELLAFRRSILRPPGHPAEPPKPADLDPLAAHLVARDAEGGILACASIHPDPGGAPGARQLRAVATAPLGRGQGHGRAVVEACIEHARTHGATLVWCHGRTTARAFYERLGFRAVGEEYVVPVSGPHFRMELRLGEGAAPAKFSAENFAPRRRGGDGDAR